MLRKRLMKRLSKSATDISSCRKNTYSTSPEEEAREFGSGSQPGRAGSAAGGAAEGDDDHNLRPSSAASSYSSPCDLGLEDDGIRSSTRSAKSEGHHSFGTRGAHALEKHAQRTRQTFAEVGIRNIGVRLGNQGFLNMLKQKFTRNSNKDGNYSSSSLPRPGKSKHKTARFLNDTDGDYDDRLAPNTSGNLNVSSIANSANVTPEVLRRSYAPETQNESALKGQNSGPEVVRIRSEITKGVGNSDPNAPEVIRHAAGIQPHAVLQNNSESGAGVELASSKIDVQTHNSKVVSEGGGKAEMIRTKDTQPHTATINAEITQQSCAEEINQDSISKTLDKLPSNTATLQSQAGQTKPITTNKSNNNANNHPTISSNSLPHQKSCDSNQSVPEDKIAELRSFPCYQVFVHLKQGHDLPAKDSCGTSDPYAKFSWKGKQVYKSKTIYKDLNPFWDESFVLTIDDPLQPLDVKVFDYDWGLRDDFIGEASISFAYLELDQSVDRTITLVENGKSEYLGQLSLQLRLMPRDSLADLPRLGTATSSAVAAASGNVQHGYVANSGLANDGNDTRGRSGSTCADSMSLASGASAPTERKKLKTSEKWSAIVSIVLIEGKDLLAMDIEGTSDPYCKFRIGNDRFKSKVIYETLCPRWLEQFDLNLFEDQAQELEVTVWDKDPGRKDDFMGRCSIDLSKREHEETHDIWVELEDGAGKLHLLFTITGRSSPELLNISDLANYRHDDERAMVAAYSWRSSFEVSKVNEIGYLEVKIFSAKGLMAADLGGKSDPYTVLELDNSRRQTHIEYKTISPVWNRALTLNVKDIHSVLHVTVYDDDRNHRSEFLGKIGIPLLKIESGKRRWYALKDKKLRCRAKGSNPQIQLQLTFYWNPVRAAIRTLNPKDEHYMQVTEKFKRAVFVNNVMRIKAIIMEFVNLAKFIVSCLEWESPVRSTVAFISFMTITYYFQPYMFPVALLLIFIKNYIVMSYMDKSAISSTGDELVTSLSEDVDDEVEGDEKEQKTTLKARLTAIQEVTAMVQNALGYVASIAERAKNTFNFSVPFLSWLAIIILVAVTLVLYFISLRFLVIVWGINKFTKKLIRPDFVPNNELLDFLSRVPDDEEIVDYRELKLMSNQEESSPQKGKSTGGKKKQKQN